MYVVVHSPKYRAIAGLVSLAIILVVYFAVIKPSNDTANKAVTQGEQQAQQAVKAANQQSGGAVPKSVVNLTSCIAAAGTNTGKLQACQAKYQP
jgi:flagellar biosynthesis/type III secretory pathway M-ring protein FliF/YscJ